MEDNRKNIITVGTFLVVFILAFLAGGDILRSLFLGILVAIITGIVFSKYKDSKENPHLQTVDENKTKSRYSENSTKIVNWKAVLIGLVVSGILVIILLTTPPPDGVTELSEEASVLFTLLLMGSVFIGGAVTGYMSHSDEGRLINSVIFTVVVGLLMALLSPLMLIFVIPGPVGGIIGAMVRKILKNN